ncbi:Os02g0711350 [Oryza sativa Japonica Group]|uniref:Os02g0711350 protein n=1 Tax=Oryza sativa subsp. japonica TaxID=39947 RepID=A0A0P0VP32_ORYSJ|nr:Os02g0711350 [Oryza sativa Japonica Group]
MWPSTTSTATWSLASPGRSISNTCATGVSLQSIGGRASPATTPPAPGKNLSSSIRESTKDIVDVLLSFFA